MFSQNTVEILYGLSNEKFIFEGVHHAQKFCILAFKKGGITERFESAFRINPREAVSSDKLDAFFHNRDEHVNLSRELIGRLSPDSLSVMEFRSELDVRIAEKMLRFPLLGEEIPEAWNVTFYREFDMTNASHLFHESPGKGRLPLYEGKMIWHFEHRYAEPRYWVDEKEGRQALLGRHDELGQKLDYQCYRFGFRDIASNTNERTAITTIIPPTFHGNKIPTARIYDEFGNRLIGNSEQLYLCVVANSFVFDFMIRMRVTTTLNFFYLYQMPVPRFDMDIDVGISLTSRAAKLICTTPEFDELAKEIGLKSHKHGVNDPAKRAQLRAELDGLVAHLYGLTEVEFGHVLSTFPLVPDPVKIAAQNAYRDVAKGLVK